ncbi:lipid-binding SYLF domain-containing protein [Pseudoxanthomonas daejeonensis]|uniref:Ligand-binding protein SH3 n=1 Tax=Pseudoxanthomonas daejeonensis TaxID=266062 RepID=A0ABQ6Z6N4_9GAMM|nr:lipid-binding SYLF domain-containing protein [Pseudoxanthomonas daejeonensis]KAF1694392.1 ligand-binding protein SH3 [Pseudoxanthomonas daejeonensis]UNK58855.1 lipid-binding SYLF domain-containing protein [Pseudoxanthomonas daejeonensis]
MSRLPKFLFSLAVLFAAGHALAAPTEEERARNAVRVLAEIQQIPEQSIPDKLLDEARGIVVVPDTIKAGLVLGGRRGHGLMSVKSADGTWSNPVFVTLTGGSIGFQAGVQSSDVVLVFRNDRSLDDIVNGKFTLGADAGVAAGPVGRNAAAATDGQLKSEIWSWSRARGLFAGVSLDGAVLQIDRDAQAQVYGATTTPRMVFEGRSQVTPPSAVVAFRDQLEEATHSARVARSGGSAPVAGAAPVVSHAPAQVQTVGTAPAPAAPGTAAPASGPAPTQGFEPIEDSGTRTEPLP